jgi:hypothetical protein
LACGSIFEDDVENALHAQTGWLAGEIPRLHKSGTKLVNLRAACPRGCTRRGRPVLRRKCKKRQLMFEIVREERRRREAECNFWASFPRKQCCGTMDGCPLPRDSS